MACFSLGDDYSAFLSLEAADADLQEARTCWENAVGDVPAISACIAEVSGHGELRGLEGPGASMNSSVDEPASEVVPREAESEPVRIPVKAKAFSHMPEESRLCKCRACILALSEPL